MTDNHMHHLKIINNEGVGRSTDVELDGIRMLGLSSVELDIQADKMVKATLKFDGVRVEADNMTEIVADLVGDSRLQTDDIFGPVWPLKAKFDHPENGYDWDKEKAQQFLEADQVYTIREMHVGSSRTEFQFWEVTGSWNSVLFTPVWE